MPPAEYRPSGLFLEEGKLLYQYQSTMYQLCRFPLEEGRIEEAYELSKQAGFDDTLDDWKEHLRLSRFAYAFIDTETGRLITTGMAVVFEGKVVRIIDILTDSSHRNRGLATTLFGYLLYQISQDTTLESLELEASALGSGLYEKFSFKTDYKIVSYVGYAASNGKETRNDQVGGSDLEAIIELDKKACGFSRDKVIREVPRDQIFVDKENGEVTGFLFYFEDKSGLRIGPLVHTNEEGAGRLLQEAFQVISHRYSSKKIYIHVPDFAVMRVLKELGFTKDDAIQTNHMFKGARIPRNRESYFAIWSTNWS